MNAVGIGVGPRGGGEFDVTDQSNHGGGGVSLAGSCSIAVGSGYTLNYSNGRGWNGESIDSSGSGAVILGLGVGCSGGLNFTW